MNKRTLKTIALTLVIGATSVTSVQATGQSAFMAGISAAFAAKRANIAQGIKNTLVGHFLTQTSNAARFVGRTISGPVGLSTGLLTVTAPYFTNMENGNPQKADATVTNGLIASGTVSSVGLGFKMLGKIPSPAPYRFGINMLGIAAATPALYMTYNTGKNTYANGFEKAAGDLVKKTEKAVITTYTDTVETVNQLEKAVSDLSASTK